jgi:hydrogenase expression/formation protein HypC
VRCAKAAGEFRALCEGGGRTEEVDLSLVGRQERGTWLLVFLGAARQVLDAVAAAQIADALAALQSVLNGNTAVDHYFADLTAKEHSA